MAFKYSFSKQYNRERAFPNVDTEGLEYHELQDIFDNEETVWDVEAIYINDKGNFGKRPCIVASGLNFRGYVNLPQHLTSMCEDILRDSNAIAAINAGKVGFTIYQYNARNYNDKLCYSIRWVDKA